MHWEQHVLRFVQANVSQPALDADAFDRMVYT